MKLYSFVLLTSLMGAGITGASESQIVTRKIPGGFHDIVNNIRMAIAGRGIHIAHVLPASSMLHRTASAFGYEEDVYANAEILEFCSAKISQKLSRIDPANIVLCPFTIGVYTLVKEPGMVRVSYRIPTGKPGTDEAIEDIVDLITGILEDASW